MRCLVFILLLFFSLPIASQQNSHACATVSDPAARLACYDAAFPLSDQTAQSVKEKIIADFGLGSSSGKLGQSPALAEPESIQSRLIKVDHKYGAQEVFHLENGQAWMRTQTGGNGHASVGDLVQVRKALISGYVLVMPNGVLLRVRRVR